MCMASVFVHETIVKMFKIEKNEPCCREEPHYAAFLADRTNGRAYATV